jgi:diacylglycerol kinase family enzyme
MERVNPESPPDATAPSSEPQSPNALIPALVNARSGSANAVVTALAGLGGFEVRVLEPTRVREEVSRLAAAGHDRVIVAGGDGTVGSAAAALRGTDTALAVLPAGTLNHFAQGLDLPRDLHLAAGVARGPHRARVDVGDVNGQTFLNTSSVGAYVAFVRLRDRWERRIGYWLASLLSAVRLVFRMRTYRVTLEVDGQTREYETPLVFVGVGERELRLPKLGARVEGGRRGLHVMVVRHRSGARVLALALAAAARGVAAVARTPAMDVFLVERCRIEPRTPLQSWFIAVDGEIVPAITPLEYAVARDALVVITDAPADSSSSLPPAGLSA